MSDERIEDVEDRLEMATPGPWRFERQRFRSEEGKLILGHDGQPFIWPDGELIANAPSDLRFLLDELKQLQGERSMERALIQEDVRDLLDALGLFSGAQPDSPHVVMRQAIASLTEPRRRVGPHAPESPLPFWRLRHALFEYLVVSEGCRWSRRPIGRRVFKALARWAREAR